MPSYSDTLDGGKPFILQLQATTKSQSVSDNKSTIHVELHLIKTGTSPSWSNNTSTWTTKINGSSYSGNFTYDFRSITDLTLWSVDIGIPHGSDGGKIVPLAATVAASGLGNASLSGSYTLDDIPRASYSSIDPTNQLYPGTTYQVKTNRKSTSFRHKLTYKFGNVVGTLGTDVATTVDWTPAYSLLGQMPNVESMVGTITCTTYDGDGDTVGTTTDNFRLFVPDSVVPSFDSISVAEATSGVSAAVGGYVQNVSTLKLGIVGASGAYNSTISAYKLQVAGQTINASSGTTGKIAASGTQTITATITDSRGRTAKKTQNINVLAYQAPKLLAISAVRALSNGTLNDDGTYIRANIQSTVTSLNPSGTQKNSLSYRISTRTKGSTTWSPVGSWVTPGGTSFNSFALAPGTYDITTAYEVYVQVQDIFTTSAVVLTLTTSTIFMHWDEKLGVGIGKYRERGQLDVKGDIYHRNGGIVQPTGMIVAFAGSNAPAGWLILNGAAISRTTYAALFALFGGNYGTGDGSTTFNLPDARGSAIVGLDSTQTEFARMGTTGGSKTHSHTLSSAGQAQISLAAGSNPVVQRRVPTSDTWDATISATTGIGVTTSSPPTGVGSGAGLTGRSDAGNSLSPYITLNWIIKT
jgi:microcystin-dependent protein